MKLKCTNLKCKNTWEYKGSADFYATCPNCLRKVKLPDKTPKQNQNSKEEVSKV